MNDEEADVGRGVELLSIERTTSPLQMGHVRLLVVSHGVLGSVSFYVWI